MAELYFTPGLPVDAVRRLIEVARTEPVGVVAVDAALHIAGSLNAYRGDGPGPFGASSASAPDCDIDECCEKIEAYLPEDEKDGVPGYEANPILNALITVLVRKILERFLPVL